jgi:site-specific DNA recombinase
MKVLGVLRLSKIADESTSIVRQRESIELWARMRGHEMVGWAEDNGVSGATDPFEREGFGPWLKEPQLSNWDVACAWKIDRFGRSVSEFLKLSKFLNDNGKLLATTDGDVDTTTPQGQFFTTLLVALAEWERRMIGMRASSSQKKLRTEGRVHGGTAPFGYRTVRRGGGVYLEPDTETAPIARQIVEKRISGMSQRQIAAWLNQQGVRTKTGAAWRQTSVASILKSRSLIGQREHGGRLVTDDKGRPLQFGDPLIPVEKWEELQAFEEGQDVRRGPLTGTPYLLRGLLFCGSCGLVMYRSTQGQGRAPSYRCASKVKAKKCPAPQQIPLHAIEPRFEALFMDTMGLAYVPERKFVPGEDHSRELAQVEANLQRYRAEADARLWDDEMDRYMSIMTNLTAERNRLRALPQRPDRWEYIPTDQRYWKVWEEADTEGRRDLLAKLQVEAKLYAPEDAHKIQMEIARNPGDGEGHRVAPQYVGNRGQLLVFRWFYEHDTQELEWETWGPDRLREVVNEGYPDEDQLLDASGHDNRREVLERLKAKGYEVPDFYFNF